MKTYFQRDYINNIYGIVVALYPRFHVLNLSYILSTSAEKKQNRLIRGRRNEKLIQLGQCRFCLMRSLQDEARYRLLIGECVKTSHSFLYSSVRIQHRTYASPFLCFRHLNPSAGIRRAHACCSKPYTFSSETLYPFNRNPIPFRQKPYTLSIETLYPFGRNPRPFCRGSRYRTVVGRAFASNRSGVSGAGMPVLHRVFRYIRIRFYVEEV